jgi:cell division protein FtsA
MKNMDEKYVAAVDLGSSAVRLCVACVRGDEVEVVHYGERESAGIRASLVFNPQLTSSVVGDLVREAEEALMVRLSQVVVGLPRKDVVQLTASMKLDRSAPNEYITKEELRDLRALALDTYPLPDPGKQGIYGVVAQSFEIDEGMTLREREVVGTLSSTLEGKFKVFVGRRQGVAALDKIFNSLGIAVSKQYFQPEVVSRAVLNDVERNGGVALVDVGGGVTSVSVYQGGILRHYASIPFGGEAITGDIETECAISADLAEKIKVRFGACQPDKLGKLSEKVLQIRLADPYLEIPVKYVSEIVDSRCREIVEAILYYIEESGFANSLRNGIVVTGGCAELMNFVSLFKEMSGYKVRTGCPRHLFLSAIGKDVFSPSAAAVMGMILCAKDDALLDCATETDSPEEEPKMVEVEVTEKTQPRDDGLLFSPDEFGEKTEKSNTNETTKTTRTVKVPVTETTERPGLLRLVWSTLGEAALKVYDFINEGEEK